MNMAEHAMVQIPKRQAKTSILLWDHPEPSQDPGWLKEVEADAPTLQSVCVLQSLKVAVGEHLEKKWSPGGRNSVVAMLNQTSGGTIWERW